MEVVAIDSDISEPMPYVYMDISNGSNKLGRIYIKLFKDSFPNGVENFMKIAQGSTFREKIIGSKGNQHVLSTRRTFDGCSFFNCKYNNYIVSGDIYRNDGSSAGTIYHDEPILPIFGEYFYPHETKGLVSLIPFVDEKTGDLFYDSTFMITLDDIKDSNVLASLDKDQIVIGRVTRGKNVIDKINSALTPLANKVAPNFRITSTGLTSLFDGPCSDSLKTRGL